MSAWVARTLLLAETGAILEVCILKPRESRGTITRVSAPANTATKASWMLSERGLSAPRWRAVSSFDRRSSNA